MKKNKVTLKQLAEVTGYSINTVSRALRGMADISKETQDKVKTLANELGYINNNQASSLRLGYTRNIAVILGDISNPHFAILMNDIEEHSRAFGYNSFLINTREDENLEFMAIQSALAKNVDGIILCPTQKSTRNIMILKKMKIPFVLIGRDFEEMDTHSVVCDDEHGGYLITRHLLEKGHRRIAMLNAPSWISSARNRYRGYERALHESGLTPDKSLIHEISLVDATNHAAFERLMQNADRFSAVFAFNDIIAWAFWSFLAKRNVEIPNTYSICGFDNLQKHINLPFRLTTVGAKNKSMSVVAVDLLIDLIANKNDEKQADVYIKKVIDIQVIEGQSVLSMPH